MCIISVRVKVCLEVEGGFKSIPVYYSLQILLSMAHINVRNIVVKFMILLSFIQLFDDVDSNYKFVTATVNIFGNYKQYNCFKSPYK